MKNACISLTDEQLTQVAGGTEPTTSEELIEKHENHLKELAIRFVDYAQAIGWNLENLDAFFNVLLQFNTAEIVNFMMAQMAMEA